VNESKRLVYISAAFRSLIAFYEPQGANLAGGVPIAWLGVFSSRCSRIARVLSHR